jgi:hypothetical protein
VAGVLLIGIELVAWLELGASTVPAPLAAAGLLLVSEVAFWSLDVKVSSRNERWIALRHGARLALTAAVGAALASLVLLAGQVPLAGSPVLTAAGAVAAVVLAGIPVALISRGRFR